MKIIEIKENDAGQRLDKFLLKTFIHLKPGFMHKAIRNKKIKVNRKRCVHNQFLIDGDTIQLFLAPDLLEEKTMKLSKGNSDLIVVYEDKNLLVVYKPIGLLSQSDKEGNQDCLVNRIWNYLASKNEWDFKSHSFRPAIAQRLDRNTEGLVMAAKNAGTLRSLNEAIAQRKIHKYYKAEVMGHFDTLEFSLDQYMKKEGTKALVSKSYKEGYKETHMKVKVVAETETNSIVEVELLTGRFHQIRAGFSYIGHTLVGDHKYGYTGNKKRYSLQAYKLDCSQWEYPMKEKILTYLP